MSLLSCTHQGKLTGLISCLGIIFIWIKVSLNLNFYFIVALGFLLATFKPTFWKPTLFTSGFTHTCSLASSSFKLAFISTQSHYMISLYIYDMMNNTENKYYRSSIIIYYAYSILELVYFRHLSVSHLL